ncbi:hypothetical protein OPV22_031236 [Ensete ventricosum]|uniref:Uncharacterized protein n=1 Tax=Ensete ventricosum TaxID=4639 RepID=A0AAV8PTY7_ENSVE|nr:hypothetical protein OPV22_031236 [Ensete ventricosum]
MVARGDGRRRRSALVLFLVHFLLFCFFLLQATEAHRSAIPSANHMSSLRRITKGIGGHGGGGSHGGGRGRARVVPGGRGGAASTRNNGAASRSYSYSFPVVFVSIAAAVIVASF